SSSAAMAAAACRACCWAASRSRCWGWPRSRPWSTGSRKTTDPMPRVIHHRPDPALEGRDAARAPDGAVLDARGRPLRDLRISVTDRCNFRCTYCMPRELFGADHVFLPHEALLTFEEITRVARIALANGVRKIRLTGGEPLLRKQIEILIGMLAALRTPDGQPPDLTLTTNGTLLARKARALADAGLSRVTVSL